MNKPQAAEPVFYRLLANRLDNLVIVAPPPPRAAALQRRAGRVPRRHVVGRAGIALLGAAGALVATTAVAFPSALPTIGKDMLTIAGLTSEQVHPAAGEAHHGAAALTVAGAYADEVSTVVFATITLHGTPCNLASAADVVAARCGDSQGSGPFLTDQYGQKYVVTGGEGVNVGPYAIFFEPVRGQAAAGGARLTIHVPVTRYVDPTHVERFDLAVPLAGSLTPGVAHNLPPRAPVVDAPSGVTYQLVAAHASATYVEVHTRLSGRLASVRTRVQSAGATGEVSPGVFLVDATGRYEIPIAGGAGTAVETDNVQDETRVFSIHGPGTYRVVVNQTSDPGAEPPGPNSVTLAQWTLTLP